MNHDTSKSLPSIAIAYSDLNMLMPEVRRIMKVIMIIAWINLGMGLLNLALYVSNPHNKPMLSTGILSILMFCTLRPMIQHALHSKNWLEICLTAVCGVYLPSFVFWISFASIMHIL